MALGQGHGGVKANNPKTPGNADDELNHRFTHVRQQVIELYRIIPWQMGAVAQRSRLEPAGIQPLFSNGILA
jgi:hypothetical protein